MLVKDVMTTPVRAVRFDATLRDVAHLMKNEDVGAVVVQKDDVTIGIATDRDLVIRGLTMERPTIEVRVQEVMTESLEAVPAEAPVSEALAAMREKSVRRLLVAGEGNAVVGLVSLGDLAQSDAGVEERAGALGAVTAGCCGQPAG